MCGVGYRMLMYAYIIHLFPTDPYHDDLSCFLTHYTLIQKMEALSSSHGGDGRYSEQISAMIQSDGVRMSKGDEGMTLPGGAMMKGNRDGEACSM